MASDQDKITKPISPPPKRRRILVSSPKDFPEERHYNQDELHHISEPQNRTSSMFIQAKDASSMPASCAVPSPVQLNFVKQLPTSSNADTVSLGSILGNVMIRECWLFNYLFDLDFVMSQFDPDTRNIVKVHVVHGSWRKDDSNKMCIDEAARRYGNIDVTTAYMPEPFGTHHSKMIVLFRHDDLAQVVILTGNFIERDWSMSQAIWQSQLLPLLSKDYPIENLIAHLPGSGPRFKHDLIAYFKSYGMKLKDLVSQLNAFDFTEVRAALIASTPGKQILHSADPKTETLWGWPSLKHILGHISMQTSRADIKGATSGDESREESPHIIIQVSSIASLGAKWLTTTFLPALSAMKNTNPPGPGHAIELPRKPRYSIVFPDTETIRQSVNGYGSGASIHIKTQTPAQAKQLSELRPMLCHWAGNAREGSLVRAAGRKRAAPHIKTYIHFSDESMRQIDWAMVSSANLSTQAWGGAASASGEVRICSYEVGVIVWPGLWSDMDSDDCKVKMVPVFGRDTPFTDSEDGINEGKHEKEGGIRKRKPVVGWRMPYDLPLVPYGEDEMPWCASEPCSERDRMGRAWPGSRK